MITEVARRVGAVAFALALGACAQLVQEKGDKGIMDREGPFAEVDMKLKVAGANVDEEVKTSKGLNGLLNRLGAPKAATPKARIDALLHAPGQKMKGAGGIQARTAAAVATVALNASGKYEGAFTSYSVKGKIQSAVGNESGFYFVPGEPMHIWVQMITTASRTTGANPVSFGRAEMFRVEVPAGAMHVEQKTGSGGNVFPIFGAAAFPIDSNMADVFNYKLWAVGSQVQVTDYWIDQNYNSASGPIYTEKYTAATAPAEFQSIFDSDPDACFDMMFELNPGLDVSDGGALNNGNLPSTAEPPYYCLGRCANPPIVNTR